LVKPHKGQAPGEPLGIPDEPRGIKEKIGYNDIKRGLRYKIKRIGDSYFVLDVLYYQPLKRLK